jgi:hypothetical protein
LASFAGAQFGEVCAFDEAVFGNDANFKESRFGDGPSFNATKFGNNIVFDSSVFGESALFDLAHFGSEASFSQAKFEDLARFNEAQFGPKAGFQDATFVGEVAFIDAIFGDRAFFHDVSAKEIYFYRTKFEGSFLATRMKASGRFLMRAAEVKGYASFSEATWPVKLEDQHGAFEGCRFRDVAEFKSETKPFTAFALFDGASFSGRVLLSNPGEKIEDGFFLDALAAANKASQADAWFLRAQQRHQKDHTAKLRQWEKTEGGKPEDERDQEPEPPPEDAWKNERGSDARFGALAGGLRTLKLAMAQQSDVEREQRFYRYEIKARARKPSEPWPAKLAAVLYGLASDYGASVGRPFAALFVVLFAFASAYCWGGMGLEVLYPKTPPADGALLERFWHALNFSLTNTFRPLSALSADGLEGNPVATQLLDGFGPGWGATVRLFAVFQSLIAVTLAFLFALAVRRRFQIT